MLSSEFLAELRRRTEAKWHDLALDPRAYGYQFQIGTRWNPGLSEEQIAAYEAVLNVQFPRDFREFLRAMNGTDLPTLNVYGSCGEPPRQSVGVYSYPRDLESVQSMIERVQSDRVTLTTTMADQGYDLPVTVDLVPIYGHRYVVCSPDPDNSAVLSIQDAEDAIVYGNSLREYLEREFLTKEMKMGK